MASSSHVRSRADRKTHMLSVPSFSRLEAGPWRPALMRGTSYRTDHCMSCASVALPTARLAHSRAGPVLFAALPAAWRANRYAGEAGPCALREMNMTSCRSLLAGRIVHAEDHAAAMSLMSHQLGPQGR